MFQLDLLTIAFATGLASLVSSSIMLVLWRINKGMPGVPQWTLSVILSAGAFLASAFRGAMPDPVWLGPVISNSLSTIAVLVALEGCLRFRGFASPHRWRLIFVLAPLLMLVTFWFHDDVRNRLLIIDSVSFSAFVAICIVMIWKVSDIHERLVYGLSSFFASLPALALLVRGMEILNTPQIGSLMDLATGNLIFIAGMLYIMGWTFSLTVACYFRAQRKISRLAREDSLTGLPNRRSIEEMLERSLLEAARYNRPFALLMIDLDEFKQINDCYGHAAGDQLLKTMGQRLQRFVRGADFAGRMSGDEFILILGNISNPETAMLTMQRLVDVVSGPAEVQGQAVHIMPSVGMAIWPVDGQTRDELLISADRRMYADKAARKTAKSAPASARS